MRETSWPRQDSILYAILHPARAEADPALSEVIEDQTRIGMYAVGLLGLIAPLLLIGSHWIVRGKELAWQYAPGSVADVVVVSDKLIIALCGVACILLSRSVAVVRRGRLVLALFLMLVVWVSLQDDVARGDTSFSAGYTALVMLVVAALPFRAWQAALVCLLVIAIHTLSISAELAARGDQTVFLGVVTLLAVGLRSILYSNTYRQYRLRKETAELAAAVTESERKIAGYAEELQQTNLQLRRSQAQLVQSAKMASLGNLVAGIAHELNSPLGAIHSNAHLAPKALDMIETSVQGGDAKLDKGIRTLKQLHRVTLDASDRINTIVRALRNFARLDEADKQTVDIHEGIESTLAIIPRGTDREIHVERRYGVLPEVTCHANQVNQVFMNVLINAVESIDREGTVSIATRHDGDVVEITVADTGRGIEERILPDIFDPGFTTKGVGVGTGLGLSTCYRILEEHGGNIAISSELGLGTTVTMRLPVSTP